MFVWLYCLILVFLYLLLYSKMISEHVILLWSPFFFFSFLQGASFCFLFSNFLFFLNTNYIYIYIHSRVYPFLLANHGIYVSFVFSTASMSHDFPIVILPVKFEYTTVFQLTLARLLSIFRPALTGLLPALTGLPFSCLLTLIGLLSLSSDWIWMIATEFLLLSWCWFGVCIFLFAMLSAKLPSSLSVPPAWEEVLEDI